MIHVHNIMVSFFWTGHFEDVREYNRKWYGTTSKNWKQHKISCHKD